MNCPHTTRAIYAAHKATRHLIDSGIFPSDVDLQDAAHELAKAAESVRLARGKIQRDREAQTPTDDARNCQLGAI